MKSYNEMAQDVLCRKNEYETRKKKQRTRILTVGLSLCCLAAIFLLGSPLQQTEPPVINPPTMADNSPVISIPDKTEPVTIPVTTAPAATQPPQREDTILINQVDGAPEGSLMGIALLLSDHLPMDKAELCSYYGIIVFPAVPAGLEEKDGHYGIYRQNGGTGEVYWEQNRIEYSNGDQTRWLCIDVDNGSLPYYQFSPFNNPEMERSEINGVEVVIGQWDAQCYFAEFMYENVGFRVGAEGLSLDELLAVLNSLIV